MNQAERPSSHPDRSVDRSNGADAAVDETVTFSPEGIGVLYVGVFFWLLLAIGLPYVVTDSTLGTGDRIALLAGMGFVVLLLAVMVPFSKIRDGAARRLVGTELELARPFWFSRRIDLSAAGEAAGKKPEWIKRSGRYVAGGVWLDWGVMFTHPEGRTCSKSPGDVAASKHLQARGCPKDVAQRWVDARERIIVIDMKNDDGLAVMDTIGRVIEAGGGRLDPSFRETLRSVRATFARSSKNVQAVRKHRTSRRER